MNPPTACRVCLGPLALMASGSDVAPRPESFAPTCHRPGAHGDLYRCRACGTVEQPSLPRGEALHDLYRHMRDQEYLEEERGRRRTARRLLDLLGPPAPEGRLLEVGCGHGLLLDEARDRGWSGVGLDLSIAAARHARERLGLEVIERPLEDSGLDPDGFDAIVIADVLEHLDDPVSGLDRCVELLAPGGALVIATPDPASLTARVAGSRWWGYIPAHFCLIPRATLRELVTARGLTIVAERPYVRSFTPAYWLNGLADRSAVVAAVGGLARRLPRRALLSMSLGDERVLVARSPAVGAAQAREGRRASAPSVSS